MMLTRLPLKLMTHGRSRHDMSNETLLYSCKSAATHWEVPVGLNLKREPLFFTSTGGLGRTYRTAPPQSCPWSPLACSGFTRVAAARAPAMLL